MADDRSALNRAFEKALDPAEAWRQQQIARLTDEQRREYERHRQEEERKREAEKKRIESQKQQWMEEEKQRRLLKHQELALRMFATTGIGERRAEELARAATELRAKGASDRADHAMQERLDEFLRQAERERAGAASFNRAAGEDKQRDSVSRAFEKATRQREQDRNRSLGRPEQRDRQRGEA